MPSMRRGKRRDRRRVLGLLGIDVAARGRRRCGADVCAKRPDRAAAVVEAFGRVAHVVEVHAVDGVARTRFAHDAVGVSRRLPGGAAMCRVPRDSARGRTASAPRPSCQLPELAGLSSSPSPVPARGRAGPSATRDDGGRDASGAIGRSAALDTRLTFIHACTRSRGVLRLVDHRCQRIEGGRLPLRDRPRVARDCWCSTRHRARGPARAAC